MLDMSSRRRVLKAHIEKLPRTLRTEYSLRISKMLLEQRFEKHLGNSQSLQHAASLLEFLKKGGILCVASLEFSIHTKAASQFDCCPLSVLRYRHCALLVRYL